MKRRKQTGYRTLSRVDNYVAKIHHHVGQKIMKKPLCRKLSNGLEVSLSLIDTSDIPQLLAIERCVYHGNLLWTKDIFLSELNQKQPHLYMKAQVAHRTIAFIGARFCFGDAHVANLAVLPDFQNQGIARLLLDQVEKWARYYHCHHMSLEVRQSNLSAQRLYRSYGFCSQRVLDHYYFDNDENGIYMEKEIER